VVSVELGKAQGCSAVAAATRVAVGLAAPKSLLKGSQLYAAGSTFGARVPSPHPFRSQYARAPKRPVFSATGSSIPTPCKYSLPPPPSTKLSILTPYSLQPYHRASGASLVSEGVGSTTSLVSNPYRRLRTCISFRQHFCICMVSS
jgi:hypothetical protein